ncbi:MAG: TRAP transporter substrate-binding protein [Gammaproteobacteria bacterium]|nr:TRAP transporter substrate-binding protein [Gammaproteobacteria bacterium]
MKIIKRRDFIAALGAGALGSAGLAACTREAPDTSSAPGSRRKKIRWKLVSTWPPNFPGVGTMVNELASMITSMSGGRLEVKVFGGGELVPALQVFDAVSRGTAELGHGAAYYWKGSVPAAQFFAAVPFGMTAQQMNAWLYYGGGIELWRELYEPFGLVPFPAGNTGVQMGGWFNREINSVEDLRGLKMRIPGLGGEVLRRAGGTPVTLPGSEIFTSLQTGAIDATEWIGPYNDLAFGLNKAAKYYYYPGWHEPGSTLECIVNKSAYESLPEDLKAIVSAACDAANVRMLSEYTARNAEALQRLRDEGATEIRRFPEPVLDKLRGHSEEILEELTASDPVVAKVRDSYRSFYRRAHAWHEISEGAMQDARSLP